MHTNQLEFWGHLSFLEAAAGGSLASRHYGMLHIAPDMRDESLPSAQAKTADIGPA